MNKFVNVFKKSSGVVIGMCHLPALPGCPKNSLNLAKITDVVLREADIYMRENLDAIMIENMHDVPYVKGKHIGPEIVAGMASVASKLRSTFSNVPIGIQILTAGNKEALAVAKSANLNFIRCEGFVFSHIGDEGWIDSSAGEVMRYRKKIEAENVLVFTDVKKKHSSHQVTSDVDIAETAQAAEFFLSDGIVVTGSATGRSPETNDVMKAKEAVQLPVLVGSGVTSENISTFLKSSSGLIIGSFFKIGGIWSNSVDPEKVKTFMKKLSNEVKFS